MRLDLAANRARPDRQHRAAAPSRRSCSRPFALGSGNQTVEQKHGDHPVRSDAERAQHQPPVAAICSPAAASISRRSRRPTHPQRRRHARRPQADHRRAPPGRRRRQRARTAARVGADRDHRSVLTEDAASPFGFKLAGVVSGLTGVDRQPARPARRPRSASISAHPTRTPAKRCASPSRCPTAPARTSPSPRRVRDAGRRTSSASAAPRRSPRRNLRPRSPRRWARWPPPRCRPPRRWRRGKTSSTIDAANPPQRVDGPPFDTATALVDGTAGNTVSWYTRRSRQRCRARRPRWRAPTSR